MAGLGVPAGNVWNTAYRILWNEKKNICDLPAGNDKIRHQNRVARFLTEETNWGHPELWIQIIWMFCEDWGIGAKFRNPPEPKDKKKKRKWDQPYYYPATKKFAGGKFGWWRGRPGPYSS